MKVAITVLALVATAELVLGEPGYGPSYGSPKPSPPQYGYNRSPNGPHNQAKYPPPPSGGYFNKNEVHSKYNPHGVGFQRGQPAQPHAFSRHPPPQPSGKLQYQQQSQQHHHHRSQQQPNQQPPHHGGPNFRPLGPQFQSKPPLPFSNGAPPHGPAAVGLEQRIQTAQQRPSPKITNIWSGPKLSGPPDFPRFTAPAPVTAAPAIAPVTQASFPVPVRVPAPAPAPVHAPVHVPFLEKPRPSYIINSDDERGPIKTIPAPNLNPADKPANFEEQLYRAQRPSPYVQPLDNTITDDKQSYQVTENPKPYGSHSSYYDAEVQEARAPHPAVDATPSPVVKLPLDVALQKHLEGQHLQQQAAADALTPQELYSLLNGDAAAAAAAAAVPIPQTAFVVQQPVMYAIQQPQLLDQLQYQTQPVQLQYAQPGAADLQYLQPQQTVQYQPQQVVQYQPQQAVQYQPQQAVQYQPQQVQYEPQQQLQQPTEHYEQQHQQQQQQQRDEQQSENDVQYQRDQGDYGDEPRNGGKERDEQQRDQNKFDSFRNQYYSAVPNEQTAGVLAQIAESAAANNDAVTAEPSRADVVDTVTAVRAVVEPTENPAAAAAAATDDDNDNRQPKTSVQIQQSVPLYEGSYTSSRRTNQEYVDDDGQEDELMEGSETVVRTVSKVSSSSSSSSVNGHAPSQFPYNAAKINAIAAD